MASRRKVSLRDLLCLDLYATSRAVTKAYRPFLDQVGLTYPQYIVMVALWEAQPLKVGELCQRLSLDSGTLSPLLKRLEAAGLVERTRGKTDEREVAVTLTDAGRALEAKASVVSDGIACLFDMKAGDVARLQETLREIRERMETEEGAAAADET